MDLTDEVKGEPKTLTLRVAEAKTRDFGRGIARIDPQVVKDLALHTGDVIQIENYVKMSKTAAILWPSYPEDEGAGIIRIDGSIRDNIKVAIDERVQVRKIKASPAEVVELAPIQSRLVVRNVQYFSQLLENRVVTQGDIVSFMIMGSRIEFVVTNYRPKADAAIITLRTKVQVNRETVSEDIKTRSKSRVSYEDIGGLGEEIKKIREMIELPFRHPEIFVRIGMAPPKGLLLYGPPGTGKTLLGRAVANETDANFINLSGPEIISRFYGASEENLGKIFKDAQDKAPSILFIDEIDSIAHKRGEMTGGVDSRVVAQLLSLMDGLENRGQVVVIGVTNRPNAIDPALRQPGRFDREIEFRVPNKEGRHEILQIHTRDMPLAEDVELNSLADNTDGFVGADLQALVKEAAMRALRRLLPEIKLDEPVPPEILEKIKITLADFQDALKEIESSKQRKVSGIVPTESRLDIITFKNPWQGFQAMVGQPWASDKFKGFENIGGLDVECSQLRELIGLPLKHPELFSKVGSHPIRGILISGPHGVGKTVLAKALKAELNCNFTYITSTELLGPFLGQTEENIRKIFNEASEKAPTIIVIDEVDKIVPNRPDLTLAEQRIVTQLAAAFDALPEDSKVWVVGTALDANNIESGLHRPGRFEHEIHLNAPDEQGRRNILQILTRSVPLAEDVNLLAIARVTEGFVGGDLVGLVSGATWRVLQKILPEIKLEEAVPPEILKKIVVSQADFLSALKD